MNRSPKSNVRRLAIGRLISVTGGAAAYTALNYTVWERTHSPFMQALSLLLTFGVAGLVGAALAALISLPTMKLKGHYFALATLAFGEAMRVIAEGRDPSISGQDGLRALQVANPEGFSLLTAPRNSDSAGSPCRSALVSPSCTIR